MTVSNQESLAPRASRLMPHAFQVVPAAPEHIGPIAANLRQADRNELWAVAALLPDDALRLSLAAPGVARTWLIDGEPAAMGGISDGPERGHGVVWLLGTDAIDRHARAFLIESRRQFEAARSAYDFVFNWVDARNVRSLRWLRWLGFEICAPQPYGILCMPFSYFFWSAQNGRGERFLAPTPDRDGGAD